MKFDVVIPQVGESINEVTIAQLLKNDGDIIESDDLICEIESDKASFEIPAEKGGRLSFKVKEGDTVAVGDTIAVIDTDETTEGNDTAPAEKESTEVKQEKEKTDKAETSANGKSGEDQIWPITVPSVGESISEVTVAAWLQPDGASVSSGDLICEIESDKASFEIPIEHGGVLRHKVREGATVAIGDVIAEISGKADTAATSSAPDKATESKPAGKKQQPAQPAPESKSTPGKTRITPLAKTILAEAGVSADKIDGSGPGGTITRDDAVYAIRRLRDSNGHPQKTGITPAEPPVNANNNIDGKTHREERRERMSTLRKTISRRLVSVKNETAMLTTFNEVDMSEIKQLRAAYKDSFKEKYGVGLGFMSFFTRAVCLALQEWPAVNASIEDDHLIYHEFCDISIAVSTPKGLVVPVIRNAEQLTMAGIEKAVIELATKARDGKLTIDEMTGGTFTLTNGGVFGSLMSTPIINAPQSAILGMHKIEDRPVALNGEVVIRPMMYLALSYDHRIIDGRESVSFLVRVKELLENPSRMLLEI